MESQQNWIHTKSWIACFDILGFKNLASFEDNEPYQVTAIIEDYEKTLNNLRNTSSNYREGAIEYCWLSDTFILFTPDDSAASYAILQQAAKYFMDVCIYSQIPMRGAISIGHITRSLDNRSFMGKGFIDAFVYAEDQDWIGLIITPMAIEKVKSFGSSPEQHDFVKSEDIPMRKYNVDNVLAYRFQNGSAKFDSPMLPILANMQRRSGEKHKLKYTKTKEFIKKYYQYIKSS